MSSLIPYLPTDESGKNSTNLVSNEECLVLNADGIKYPVITLENGGFYTPELQVRDKNFKLLTAKVDYVATHKYADASAYTGIEICGAIVLLNPSIKDVVYVTAQMVGGDLAFNLKAREDTLQYLRGLGTSIPIWSGFLGEEPLWQDGQLRRDRWSLKGLETFVLELNMIERSLREGDPLAENETRSLMLREYNNFMDNFNTGLEEHLRDEANPHADTKHDVGLGSVLNLRVATTAIARAGQSNTDYLTPALFNEEANALAVPVLNAHLANRNNPHKTTAAQAKTYTKQEFDAKMLERLAIGATADNSLELGGFSYTEVYQKVRASLDASFFTAGRFAASQIGINLPAGEAVLLDNGRWISVAALFAQYQKPTGSKFIYMGSAAPSTVYNTLVSVYSDMVAWPPGTVAFYRYSYKVNYGAGNGVGNTTITSTRAYYRAASGAWVDIA